MEFTPYFVKVRENDVVWMHSTSGVSVVKVEERTDGSLFAEGPGTAGKVEVVFAQYPVIKYKKIFLPLVSDTQNYSYLLTQGYLVVMRPKVTKDFRSSPFNLTVPEKITFNLRGSKFSGTLDKDSGCYKLGHHSYG